MARYAACWPGERARRGGGDRRDAADAGPAAGGGPGALQPGWEGPSLGHCLYCCLQERASGALRGEGWRRPTPGGLGEPYPRPQGRVVLRGGQVCSPGEDRSPGTGRAPERLFHLCGLAALAEGAMAPMQSQLGA